MAKNKIKRETKPIGFRLLARTADSISSAAKEKGITIQEYFLSQIRPGSELDAILKQEQVWMMEQSQNIANVRDRMQEEAQQMQKDLGISEEEFKAGLVQALTILLEKKK